jgi:hypothetical protein
MLGPPCSRQLLVYRDRVRCIFEDLSLSARRRRRHHRGPAAQIGSLLWQRGCSCVQGRIASGTTTRASSGPAPRHHEFSCHHADAQDLKSI